MSVRHVITKEIGNLRGFSTDSMFLRPPNVADRAINLQKAPDLTTEIRRGYQCQIAQIGGLGLGTFDDPTLDKVQTVTLGLDGFLYNKLTKQIFFYYNGQVTGVITGVTNSNPAVVESIGHGLQTGAQVILRNIGGMTPLNNASYTITVVDVDHFSLDGIDTTNIVQYPPYTSGGYWSITFADQRYLTITIFTDPRFLSTNPGWSVAPWSISPWGAPSGESITCNVTVNRAAQIDGNQSNVNTVNVEFGHELFAGDVIQFNSSNGVLNQRNVLATTVTTITFDGTPVTVLNGVYINQFFDIPFRKGFDVSSPYLISTFIDTLTDPNLGVFGLEMSINGDADLPAAFLQIFEPTIVDSNRTFIIDYWYWKQINFTLSPPFPGSANTRYQNSPDFENASTAVFDDVIYVANGWDFPQKYDGQTVYRTGMPLAVRPSATDNTTFVSLPFVTTDEYEYAITYEQIDNRGHIVEGEVSEVWKYTVVAANAASNVVVTNLQSSIDPITGKYSNWNTNGAIATGGVSTAYGPDIDGFYYDLVAVTAGYTLKIGDSAYYGDVTGAVITGGLQTNVITINVLPGFSVLEGDTIYFIDTSNVERQRVVASVDYNLNTVTIVGEPVTVNPTDATHANMLVYKVSRVFGNVAIINGNQSNVNIIVVNAGHTIQLNDVVNFIDSEDNIQRRNVVGVGATTVTIDGIAVSVSDLILISSENQRTNAINIQRINANPATLGAGKPISNNLRISIYRTQEGESFGVNGELFLVASIPNDSSGVATQTYIDGIPDGELGRQFDDPDQLPNPPPISKYIVSFGNQLFYAGGERGKAENSDRVFFSDGNAPEIVPLASNFFNVPNLNDDITGLGVAGTTIVTTKNNSLWAATGNFLTGQIEVIQIAQGTNIGCVAHATIASVGTMMYFVHTNGVYSITENQLFPTDKNGNPVPISLDINGIFRETNFLPQTRYVFKRAVAINYTKDNQYLLFLPCEDTQSTIRTANANSIVLCYDYQNKDWYQWININAAGGMAVIDDDLFFQERRFSGVDGNTANFYKQHRFYRLIDHADHAGPQRAEWRSSWTDLGQPEVRKKFCRCVLLLDRVSDLQQFNNPDIKFSSYLNRLPNLQSTIASIAQVDNVRNSSWSYSGWGWNYWSGYQDSFVTVNLKGGTVAKSIQVGFTIQGINMNIKLAGYQLEAIPENRNSVLR